VSWPASVILSEAHPVILREAHPVVLSEAKDLQFAGHRENQGKCRSFVAFGFSG